MTYPRVSQLSHIKKKKKQRTSVIKKRRKRYQGRMIKRVEARKVENLEKESNDMQRRPPGHEQKKYFNCKIKHLTIPSQ